MQLLSIADLSRPQEEIAPLLAEAENFSRRYTKFIESDTETYSYTVTRYADSERAEGFHASELSGCARRLVYARSGAPKVANAADANMLMRFRMGDATHAMLQSDMSRMAAKSGGSLYFEAEAKIAPELQEWAAYYDIHSHCDGVVTFCRWYPEYNQWYAYMRMGVEIKTKSDGEYAKLKVPESAHYEQTCVYMRCLDLPLMYTFYYNKSNSNFTRSESPWLYTFDGQLWDKLTERMGVANEYAAQNQLPAREEGMPCGWCPFAHICEPAFLKKKKERRRYSNPQVSPALRIVQ